MQNRWCVLKQFVHIYVLILTYTNACTVITYLVTYCTHNKKYVPVQKIIKLLYNHLSSSSYVCN